MEESLFSNNFKGKKLLLNEKTFVCSVEESFIVVLSRKKSVFIRKTAFFIECLENLAFNSTVVACGFFSNTGHYIRLSALLSAHLSLRSSSTAEPAHR